MIQGTVWGLGLRAAGVRFKAQFFYGSGFGFRMF